MANEVSEALAKAEAFPPPYKPYIAPDYTAHPWMPRMTLRTSALAKWRARVSRVSGKQDISFQMRMRHHLRFVFAADLRHAWGPFGGLSAQLSQLAAILSLASTENCTYATIYHKELVRFLADSTRARIPLGFRNYLSEVKEDICKLIPAILSRPKPDAPAPLAFLGIKRIRTLRRQRRPLLLLAIGRARERAKVRGRTPPVTLSPRLTQPLSTLQ